MRSAAAFVVCAFGLVALPQPARGQPAVDGTLRALVSGALDGGEERPVTVDWLADRLLSTIKANRSALARLPARECLMSIAPDGTLVDEADGDESGVVIPRAFDDSLRRAGAGIVLVHNHPRGNGLSGADLGQLSKPGVAGIIAVGHDGSLYAAAAGPAYPPAFESDVYPRAMAEIIRRLRAEAVRDGVESTAFNTHVEHVIAQSLKTARMIRYRAELGPTRFDSYRKFEVIWRDVSEEVAGTLRRAPGGPGGRVSRRLIP